jgi:hypothetical protein
MAPIIALGVRPLGFSGGVALGSVFGVAAGLVVGFVAADIIMRVF